MTTVVATALPLALALASVVVTDAIAVGIDVTSAVTAIARAAVVANPVTVGIDVTGAVGSGSGGVSMMGAAIASTITDAIARAAVIADAIVIGIDVTSAVTAITGTVVIANPVAVGIHVAPPGDGLRGHVRRHGSLPRGQVSHTKRESRNGKDDAQSRGRNRDHFPLH